MTRGSWVWTLYPAGNHIDTAYGKVVATGARTVTVQWENGTRNRIRHADLELKEVRLVKQPGLLAELEANWRAKAPKVCNLGPKRCPPVWICRSCGRNVCEHFSSHKSADGTHAATCGKCRKV